MNFSARSFDFRRAERGSALPLAMIVMLIVIMDMIYIFAHGYLGLPYTVLPILSTA